MSALIPGEFMVGCMTEMVSWRVLGDQDGVLVLARGHRVGRVDEEQVVALAAVLAHRHARVAAERLDDEQDERAVGLGEVDVVARLGTDAAGDDRRRVLRVTVPGVDLEVVAEAVRGTGGRGVPMLPPVARRSMLLARTFAGPNWVLSPDPSLRPSTMEPSSATSDASPLVTTRLTSMSPVVWVMNTP